MLSVHEHSMQFFLILFAVCVVLPASEALDFKAGKDNLTTDTLGIFACKKIFFPIPFQGGGQVKVFASVGHTVKSKTPRNGAAVWVEDVKTSEFTVCVFEFGNESKTAANVNWIAFQPTPHGSQIGTASLNTWTTETKCERIDFQQRFSTPPTIFVTACHRLPRRPQDAMAVWVEEFSGDSFKVCLREAKIFDGPHKDIKINWMAFTSLGVENFTSIGSLVFSNTDSPSLQDTDNVFCKTINFTKPFYATPVVLVTPKHSDNNNDAPLSWSSCNAVTAWVEHVSTAETRVCVEKYSTDAQNDEIITVDYLITGDLDPCINVTCGYHCMCKAFEPHDARCVPVESCPSYEDPVCSSNGTTYENECLFRRDMCILRLNFSVQHPGSCEGFPFQRGRHRMIQISSPSYYHCEVIHFKTYVFYPDKPVEVQITVNYIDTSNRSFVHDAAASWVENVNFDQFTACVMAAGFNERMSHSKVTVDWMAFQGAPVGGVAGEIRIPQWWTGTTCKAVKFLSGKFSVIPSVFVTAVHNHAGLKRDAASVWIEDVKSSEFQVCLRELQNYAGSHDGVYVKWLAFSSLHKPLFLERKSLYFTNLHPPPADYNNAYCKDVQFTKTYSSAPSVFVSANHSSSGGNQQSVHNGITAWVEYINTTGARVCLKELYETKYDPLSISYTVLPDICRPGWNYFNGYCYYSSPKCASWLTANSICSSINSDMVTVHTKEENLYIQHLHGGVNSWIGLNDRSVEGSFAWANKENSTFRFWSPNQPNDRNDGKCVHTLGAKNGYTWSVVPCNNCLNFTCFTDQQIYLQLRFVVSDLDECSTQTDNCDVNAVYLDECKTHTDYCDVNADCENTVGSYRCSCKAGYKGDGQTCKDVDECNTRTDNCDANAVCRNTVGSYVCTCKAGYKENGEVCKDLDECKTHTDNCDVNADCKNTVGSYTCSCKSGYKGDGQRCKDIDECVSGVNDCHSSASCTNTVGSYSCSCNQPYTGDGKTCSLAAECQNYRNLTSADRNVNYDYVSIEHTIYCDAPLGRSGWFPL
ncbi:hypothetical protein ACROYT_G029957 [Oculina patagonica]